MAPRPAWATILAVLALALVLLATACQALAPQSAPPTLTPALLAPATPGQTRTEPTAAPPSATPTVQASPTATRQPPSPTPAAPSGAGPIAALGVQSAVTVRAAPADDAPRLATAPGATVFLAEARTAEADWLRVAYGDPVVHGWVAAADVKLLGDPQVLPVTTTAVTLPAAQRGGPQASRLRGRVNAGTRVNVRAGPGLDQPVVDQFDPGAAVGVIGRSQESDWLAIEWGGRTAWIAAFLVDVAGDVGALPVLAAATTRLGATTAGFAGQVAFQTASGGDIYVVNADGSGLRRVASGLDPALSPDGERLAFARWGAGQGVYVLNLATGAERRVASANHPRSPTWSTDGGRLAFAHAIRSHVCLQTPFGCLEESAARGMLGGKDCLDTPQGRLCIQDFERRQVEDAGLAQVALRDGGWLDLSAETTVQSVNWHPRRDEIIYRGRDGLQVTGVGAQTRPLVNEQKLRSPAWSPDGQRIVAQFQYHDHTDIVLLDAAGVLLRRLTEPSSAFGRPANNVAAAWSPDGRHILFLSDRDGAWRFYTMNSDGSQQALFLPAVLGDLRLKYEFAAERMISWR